MSIPLYDIPLYDHAVDDGDCHLFEPSAEPGDRLLGAYVITTGAPLAKLATAVPCPYCATRLVQGLTAGRAISKVLAVCERPRVQVTPMPETLGLLFCRHCRLEFTMPLEEIPRG